MEKLFNKPLQVNMRCKDCEDRKANVRVTIELQPTTSSVHKTELRLRLTDDADPYFLFSLSISEEDFQSLKVQQGLLITFNEFPQKFIDLLNLCKQESDSDNPRFLLQLSQSPVLDSSADFSVVETNAFKRLNHLTLRLLQGSDTDIKKHLAVCLSSMKEEKHSFEEKLKKTEDELSYALQKLTEKTRELDKLRAEWTSQEKTISSHYSQDLISEREKALEIQTRLQQQSEDLRQDLEGTHKRSTHQLQTRLAELETSNRELTERKYKSESTIRDLQIKLVGAEEEAQRAKQQVLSLRRENGTLDTECHEKERSVSQLQMRTAVLEQEVKDKDQLMCRTKELLEATQQQKDSIEGNTGKLEETVKLLSADIIKANEIIKKYMGEVQKLSNKNKMKNIVTVEQEKVLLKTEEELQIVTKDLENAQQQLKHKDEQVSKFKEQLETTMQKLNESKEVLKTNENVINWLNKQLNEKLLCRKPPSPSPESFETPSVLPTAAGLRAHFYPMSGKPGLSPMEAIHVIPIEQHPIHLSNKQSGEPVGLDSKYFERRDDSIPLHGLLPNLQNRELPQRPSKHTSSAFFTG